MLSEAQGGTGGRTRDLQNSLRLDLRPLSLTRGSFDIRLDSDWLQLSHFALVWDDWWLFLFMVFWRWFLMKNLDWNPVKNSCIRTTSKKDNFSIIFSNRTQCSQTSLNSCLFFFSWAMRNKVENLKMDQNASILSRLRVSETSKFHTDLWWGFSWHMFTLKYTQSLAIRFFKSYVERQ